MRLDKYLKVSRLIKRRTVAKEACDKGRIELNGKTAKAGSDVSTDDIIEIKFGNSKLKIKVLDISEKNGSKNVRKEDASLLYEILSKTDINPQEVSEFED